MSGNVILEQWEEEAFSAAEDLENKIFEKFDINNDSYHPSEFLKRLLNREHLNKDFLKDV